MSDKPSWQASMDNLSRYLQACQHAGAADKKRLSQAVDPALKFTDVDGKVWKVRDLLLTNQLETSGLVQAQVMDTLMEGANFEKCVRELLPITPCNSDTFYIPLRGARTSYWPEVAQAVAFPILNQDYGVASGSVKKYGGRPLISNEMVNDGKFDLIAAEMLWAGACGENTLNRLVVTELLDSANNEMDTTGSSGWTGIKAISSAVSLGKVDGFRYDRILLAPDAEATIGREYLPVGSYWPTSESQGFMTKGAGLGTILGMRSGVWAGGDSSSTYTWGYGTDGYIGMLLLQANAGVGIAMRQDISAEEYADPIHDLTGLKCAMRVGVDSPASNNGICRVEY